MHISKRYPLHPLPPYIWTGTLSVISNMMISRRQFCPQSTFDNIWRHFWPPELASGYFYRIEISDAVQHPAVHRDLLSILPCTEMEPQEAPSPKCYPDGETMFWRMPPSSHKDGKSMPPNLYIVLYLCCWSLVNMARWTPDIRKWGAGEAWTKMKPLNTFPSPSQITESRDV